MSGLDHPHPPEGGCKPLWWSLRLGRDCALPAVVLPFSADAFDPGAFALHGIVCPPSIQRSVPVRQAEFFQGRLAAKMALAPWGQGAVEVGIGLSREPLWPPGLLGSISHTRQHAAALVAQRGLWRGVGVDVEHRLTPDQQAVVAAMAVTPDEQARWSTGCVLADPGWHLALAFSAKECFYKAVFEAVEGQVDFTTVQVTDIDEQGGWVSLTVVEALCAEFPAGRRCDIAFAAVDAETVITSFGW